MAIEQLCPDLQVGIGKVFPGQAVGTSCSALQAQIWQTGVVPALHISFASYQRVLQVLHPEAFARHLAGRV